MAKRIPTEEIIKAYEATRSIWLAGKRIGLSGQSVWDRLKSVGYPLPQQAWTDDELAQLRSLAGTMPLVELSAAIGRPYASTANKLSQLGISGRFTQKQISLRGTGLTKTSTKKLVKELDSFDGAITHFCKLRGYRPDPVIKAIQKYEPEFWAEYSKRASCLPLSTCGYCNGEFYPLNKKQKTCSRRCQSHLRSDKQYFNGQKKATIGLASGVCQLCLRERKRLSSHHVWGKEHDPEAKFLIALCNGCHDLVGRLASTTISGDVDFLERLLIFANMRRQGARQPLGFHCEVEFEELSEQECAEEMW